MDRKTKLAIYKSIQGSTIGNELKLAQILASACQNVTEHAFRRMKSVYLDYGQKMSGNEMLSGLNDYCHAVKNASFHFYERVNPYIVSTTWEVGVSEDEQGNIVSLQGFENRVNECVRLLMKYLNCADDKEAYQKVFTLLSKLPKDDTFDDKDIAHYKVNM